MFFKILSFNVFVQKNIFNIFILVQTYWKNRRFSIYRYHYSDTLLFFLRNVSSSCFFMTIVLITLQKKSARHHLVNCLKIYLLYIPNRGHLQIKTCSKIYTFKKIKDLTGYGGLHRIYRSLKYIFLLC